MTALLTDEEIERQARAYKSEDHEFLPSVSVAFEVGADRTRSIYEARLAEEKVVRAELVEALNIARTRVLFDSEEADMAWESEVVINRIDAALSAAKEIK